VWCVCVCDVCVCVWCVCGVCMWCVYFCVCGVCAYNVTNKCNQNNCSREHLVVFMYIIEMKNIYTSSNTNILYFVKSWRLVSA